MGLRRAIMALTLLTIALQASGEGLPLIIIDPGHGGRDWGATRGGRKEKDICLVAAKKLRDRLRRDTGWSVRLTRESDEYLRLDRRIQETSTVPDAIFLSLHVNDNRDKTLSGMNVYTFGKSGQRWKRHLRWLPFLPAPPPSERHASAMLSASLVRSLRSSGFRVEDASKAEYYVLRNPDHPSVLIELGYLSNPKDASSMTDAAYQDRVAATLARGLAEHLAKPPRESAHQALLATTKKRDIAQHP